MTSNYHRQLAEVAHAASTWQHPHTQHHHTECRSDIAAIALALAQHMGELSMRLFEHIKHGDEAHQAWLKTELDKFFATLPPPPEPIADKGEKV